MEFCIKFPLVALPALVTTLAWFAQYISKSLKSHGSVQNYLSAVKKLHHFLGCSMKDFKGFILQLKVAGLRHLNVHVVQQALPVTLKILEQVYRQFNMNVEEDRLVWGAALTAFFLLFRKSNLLPLTKTGFNKDKQLTRGDLTFTGTNLVVGITWSKNHQFGRNLLTFPLPFILDSCLCPVTAIFRILITNKASSGAHLFSFRDGTSLTYSYKNV